MEREDTGVKLALQALQMSVSTCLDFPDIPQLRQQMLGRLLAESQAGGELAGWHATQTAMLRAAAVKAVASGASCHRGTDEFQQRQT
jgi:hypothetical protein